MIDDFDEKRRVVFVCRAATGESLRSARALKQLEHVLLFAIVEDLTNSDVFVDAVQVTSVHDTKLLIKAARGLSKKYWVDFIVTAQETLLEPVAKTREALDLRGMEPATVRRTLNKAAFKSTLREAGIPTPPDRIVTSLDSAVRFISEFGYPILLKPLSGSGALATLLIRNAAQLEEAIKLMEPSFAQPVLAESYLRGQELCLDTIMINNEPMFYSICRYYPSILEALEHPETQWTAVMPRDIGLLSYRDLVNQGLAAFRALEPVAAMVHMEGFVDTDGKLLGFTDATLRPAGARIAPMMGFAYDIDPYYAWARVAVDECFDGPWQRKYAVGTIFLRGLGAGVIEGVEGVDAVTRELGDLVVDARWPNVGAQKAETYTGDGYVTVRHPDTAEVETALKFIGDTIRLTYSEPQSALQWRERFQNYQKLNRPAWEVSGQK